MINHLHPLWCFFPISKHASMIPLLFRCFEDGIVHTRYQWDGANGSPLDTVSRSAPSWLIYLKPVSWIDLREELTWLNTLFDGKKEHVLLFWWGGGRRVNLHDVDGPLNQSNNPVRFLATHVSQNSETHCHQALPPVGIPACPGYSPI